MFTLSKKPNSADKANKILLMIKKKNKIAFET